MQAREVLDFIEENDVRFVRLAFPDLFGQLKNIAVQPDQLERAFETGVPFDAGAVDGFECARGTDLLLRPDPETLCILPWRPQAGRVCRLLCDILTPEGEPFEADARGILRSATQAVADAGLSVRIGSECEFYLLETDEQGRVTERPQDAAGYMDVAPLDRGEDVRREICLSLAEMNIRPESSHHERGPGQNEIDFHRADPLTAADHLIAFYNAVRSIAARYGLHASFLPKPLASEAGNALHINLALYRENENLFRLQDGKMPPEAGAALAGVLRRLPEMTLLLNPLPSSYERLSDEAAARRAAWSFARCGNALRVPLPQHRFARLQLASPDPSCNAYLAFALVIRAALEGMRDGLTLPPENEAGATALPVDMLSALALAKKSDFLRTALPQSALDAYLRRGEALAREYAIDRQRQSRLLLERL